MTDFFKKKLINPTVRTTNLKGEEHSVMFVRLTKVAAGHAFADCMTIAAQQVSVWSARSMECTLVFTQ